MATLRERYFAALEARGEILHKANGRYRYYTRKEGGFWLVARSGALRYNVKSAASKGAHPASVKVKMQLLCILEIDPHEGLTW